MSRKSRLLSLLGGLVLQERVVRAVRVPSSSFRIVDLAPPPSGERAWGPGDKVQVLLDDEDEVRTYTPVASGADGSMSLVAFVHGDTPASRWAQRVTAGQRVRFMAPARSLSMPPGPITLIGDETSLAVAAAYARARPGEVRALFEVGDGAATADTVSELGLADVTIATRTGDGHGAALLDAIGDVRGSVGLTGGGALIQRVRDGLRDGGVRDIKAKAYWIEGRRGID